MDGVQLNAVDLYCGDSEEFEENRKTVDIMQYRISRTVVKFKTQVGREEGRGIL